MRDRVVVSLRVSGDVIVSKPSARFEVCVCVHVLILIQVATGSGNDSQKAPGINYLNFSSGRFYKKKKLAN